MKCKDCDLDVSGLGRCTVCNGPLCMFDAVFMKDGVRVPMFEQGGKPYCEEDAQKIVSKEEKHV